MRPSAALEGRPLRGRLSRLSAVLAGLSALLATAALAGGVAGASQERITVFAAASLTDVFPRIDPGQRYSFAGSNTLAAQIEHGARAGIFASANMSLPRRLAREGLCSRPVVFARNALVLIVPRANPADIATVRDLRRPGTKLVVAGSGVPVGSYTRRVLRNMRLSGVLSRVVSNETDVRGVLAKVALGEADAGFVYATDAATARDRVTAFALPARARANVRYAICITTPARDDDGARAFVARVLGKAGQTKLVAAGFLPRVPAEKRK